MGFFPKPFDPEAKKKKLDELFAKEPHLSTTMKARRLHEQLEANEYLKQLKEREQPYAAPDAKAGVDEAVVGRNGEEDPDAYHTRQSGVVDLARAAAYLRAKPGVPDPSPEPVEPACAARLVQFRERALKSWLEGVPSREDCF